MTLPPKARASLLLVVLALTLAAAIGSDGTGEPPQVIHAVVREPPTARTEAEPSPRADLARLDPQRLAARYEDRRFPDLMAPRSWVPPPPPPPKPTIVRPVDTPPPAPSAPPLPFQYAGKLAQWSDQVHVYLLRGNEAITASPGDTIAGTYRLERVDDTQLTFVYLPLNQTQTLTIPQR